VHNELVIIKAGNMDNWRTKERTAMKLLFKKFVTSKSFWWNPNNSGRKTDTQSKEILMVRGLHKGTVIGATYLQKHICPRLTRTE